MWVRVNAYTELPNIFCPAFIILFVCFLDPMFEALKKLCQILSWEHLLLSKLPPHLVQIPKSTSLSFPIHIQNAVALKLMDLAGASFNRPAARLNLSTASMNSEQL